MSKGVCRLGDLSRGHDCWPPTPSIEASDNVFCNGLGINRQGDKWEEHTCGEDTHQGKTYIGSLTVFVNGLGMGRYDDEIECPEDPQFDYIDEVSVNVFCGP